MTQEDKDCLIRDLCARLPYKVKVQDTYYKSLEPAPIWLIDLHAQNVRIFADEGYQSIEYIKPYLFPLSSMTVEQKREFDISMDMGYAAAYNVEINCVNRMIDFFHKHHIDYRGLIEMGLAIDATGLNIY